MRSVDTGCLQAAAGWFHGVERALIVTHIRPDGETVEAQHEPKQLTLF